MEGCRGRAQALGRGEMTEVCLAPPPLCMQALLTGLNLMLSIPTQPFLHTGRSIVRAGRRRLGGAT